MPIFSVVGEDIDGPLLYAMYLVHTNRPFIYTYIFTKTYFIKMCH